MPDGVNELEWRLKAGQVEQKLKDLAALEDKVTKSVGNTSREVNKADKELERFAKRMEGIHATPFEKLSKDADQLKRAMAAGVGDAEKLSRALGNVTAQQDAMRRAAMQSSGIKFVTPADVQARIAVARDAFVNAKADPRQHQANAMAALTTPKSLDAFQSGMAAAAAKQQAERQSHIDAFVNAKADPRQHQANAMAALTTPKSLDAFQSGMAAAVAKQEAERQSHVDAFVNAKSSGGGGGDMAALTTPKVDYMALQRKKTGDATNDARLAANKRLADSEKAWGDAVAAANKKVQGEVAKTTESHKQLRGETLKLSSAGMERYKARVAELTTALKQGGISQAEFSALSNEASRDLSLAGDSASKAFGPQALGMLAKFTGGVLTISGAVKGVTEGFEEQLRIAKEMKEVNLGLAGAQANATLNFTGLTNEQKSDLLNKTVPEMQQETGFGDQKKLIEGLGTAYAASNDIEKSKLAVTAAAKISRNSPEQLEIMSGAALDIMRATGVEKPEDALGFLLQTNARVVDPRKLAENLPPTLAAAANSAKGDDNIEASKLASSVFSVLSREGTDKEGDRTRTSSMHFFGEMREFFEKGEHGKDPNSLKGRLEKLQQNAKLRKQFLDSYKGEQQFKPGIENLLTPGTVASKEVWTDADKLRFDRKEYDQLSTSTVKGTPQLQMGASDATLKGNLERFDTNTAGIIRAKEQQAFDAAFKAMERTDKDVMDVWLRQTDRYVGSNLYALGGKTPLDSAEATVQSRLNIREGEFNNANNAGDGPTAAILQDHVNLLRSQLEEFKAIRKELEDIKASNRMMANEPASRRAIPDQGRRRETAPGG